MSHCLMHFHRTAKDASPASEALLNSSALSEGGALYMPESLPTHGLQLHRKTQNYPENKPAFNSQIQFIS